MKERRLLIRRQADREFLELVEKKTGLRPDQLVVRAKRRRVIRHLCRVELTLEDDLSMRIEGRVLDLSEGGASLFADQEVATGQRCRVKLKIIDGGIIESAAEVRWASRKDAKEGFAIGIRFNDMEADNAKRLETFLARLEATLGL